MYWYANWSLLEWPCIFNHQAVPGPQNNLTFEDISIISHAIISCPKSTTISGFGNKRNPSTLKLKGHSEKNEHHAEFTDLENEIIGLKLKDWPYAFILKTIITQH